MTETLKARRNALELARETLGIGPALLERAHDLGFGAEARAVAEHYDLAESAAQALADLCDRSYPLSPDCECCPDPQSPHYWALLALPDGASMTDPTHWQVHHECCPVHWRGRLAAALARDRDRDRR